MLRNTTIEHVNLLLSTVLDITVPLDISKLHLTVINPIPITSYLVQEEIKITSVTVFVNPYSEPDEEEEEKQKDEKNVEDEENVCLHNPLTFAYTIYICII